MPVKLTKPQVALLRDIARPGPPPTWREACASGNLAPVYVRLVDMGLITDPPFRVTPAGRQALETSKPAPMSLVERNTCVLCGFMHRSPGDSRHCPDTGEL